MKRAYGILFIAFQLSACAAVKTEIPNPPVHDPLMLQSTSLCIADTVTDRNEAYHAFRTAALFDTVIRECEDAGQLRVSRFDFKNRALSAECGAAILTVLSLGLIPSTCTVQVGGSFCLKQNEREKCFGPKFFSAQAVQGIFALPLLFSSSWSVPDFARYSVAHYMIRENMEAVFKLHGVQRDNN